MATAKGEVTLRGGFPAGERVELHVRSGDWFPLQGAEADKLGDLALGKPEASASVGKDSCVSFDGLEPGRPFWAVGLVDGVVRARAVTAKVPASSVVVADLPLGRGVVAPRKPTSPQSVAPGVNTGGKVIGQRSSRPRSQETGVLSSSATSGNAEGSFVVTSQDSTDLKSQAERAKEEAEALRREQKNARARQRRKAAAKKPAKKVKATTAKKPKSGSNRRK